MYTPPSFYDASSSYYGPSPTSTRSSSSLCSKAWTEYAPVSSNSSRTSLREHTPPPPPTPLKATYAPPRLSTKSLSLRVEPPTAFNDPRTFAAEPALPTPSYTPASYKAPSPFAYTTSPFSPTSTQSSFSRTLVSPVSQGGLSPLLEGVEATVSPRAEKQAPTPEPDRVLFHPDYGCLGIFMDERQSHFNASLASAADQRKLSVQTHRTTNPIQPPVSRQSNLSSPPNDAPTPTSAEELNTLWNAAQGAPRSSDGKIFVLNMYQQPITEHYTFGPTPLDPFYSLTSCEIQRGINEITLTRNNATLRDSQKIAIMQPQRNGLPAPGGLVTHIFPRRAVVSAERELSRVSPVSRSAPVAVKAAEPELCKLVWAGQHRRYELEHPAMSSSHPHADPALVVKLEGRVGFNNPTANGKIKLLNMTNKEILASLDFGRGLLCINTAATAKVESRHIVDVAVATIIAVATVEGRKFRERRAMEMKRIADERRRNALTPRKVIMVLIDGVWTLVCFTVRLGWEIGKAIVEACRPIKRRRKY